jgi:stress-induced morphogen
MNTEQIKERIIVNYPKSQVVVLDQTGSSDHFEVRISDSELFKLPRIKRHQSIMELFKPELSTGEIHALSIKVLSL